MAYNNNFFNFNEDPCYTPTSYSDITNPAYHNFDQPSVPDWSYPNHYMPQSQYYEQDWNNHHYSSQSQWGFNTPEPYGQPPVQPLSSYTSFPTSPRFQSSIDLFDGLEEKVDRLQDTMNDQISRLSNILEHLDRNQESFCLEDLDQNSISSHQYELAQSQSLDKLASFNFNEIELDYECEPDPQLCDSVSIFESMLTPVSLPNLDQFSEPTFIPIPIDHEIESPIFDDHIELDQLCNFESPMEKLASSHFYEIETNEICDLDSQIYDQVQIPESLLTPVLLPDLGNILESVLIPTPIIPELESPTLSHIPLWENDCRLEFQFLDLDPLLDPSPTPEPLLDLSFFPESVLDPEPIILESKSTILPSHILLLDIGIDHDSVMIFQDWSCKGSKFHERIFHDPIHSGDCKYVNKKEVNKGRSRELPRYLVWAAFRGPIRPPPEPPP